MVCEKLYQYGQPQKCHPKRLLRKKKHWNNFKKDESKINVDKLAFRIEEKYFMEYINN